MRISSWLAVELARKGSNGAASFKIRRAASSISRMAAAAADQRLRQPAVGSDRDFDDRRAGKILAPRGARKVHGADALDFAAPARPDTPRHPIRGCRRRSTALPAPRRACAASTPSSFGVMPEIRPLLEQQRQLRRVLRRQSAPKNTDSRGRRGGRQHLPRRPTLAPLCASAHAIAVGGRPAWSDRQRRGFRDQRALGPQRVAASPAGCAAPDSCALGLRGARAPGRSTRTTSRPRRRRCRRRRRAS